MDILGRDARLRLLSLHSNLTADNNCEVTLMLNVTRQIFMKQMLN